MAKSRHGQRLDSVQDLAFLKAKLEEQRQIEELAEEELKRAQMEAEADAQLFQQFVQDKSIQPLKVGKDRHFNPPKPDPIPRHSNGNWSSAGPVSPVSDQLSDGWCGQHLFQDKDGVYYCKSGVRLDTLKRLRKGQWVVQAQIDLHGHRAEEARVAIHEFIHACAETDLRCVRVVHGKGLSSVGGESILKEKVKSWLVQIKQVLAFCQAPVKDGGDGALLILLKARKRINGMHNNGEPK